MQPGARIQELGGKALGCVYEQRPPFELPRAGVGLASEARSTGGAFALLSAICYLLFAKRALLAPEF